MTATVESLTARRDAEKHRNMSTRCVECGAECFDLVGLVDHHVRTGRHGSRCRAS